MAEPDVTLAIIGGVRKSAFFSAKPIGYVEHMKLGLLAAARITTSAIIEPAAELDSVDLVAVAARDMERAQTSAAEWNIPTAYGSYEELVAADDIDAIYIATPAALHHRWTLAALAAGKHVLCEKPIAANAVEAREMVAAADEAFATNGQIFMEAYHWRYHPMVAQMRDILDSGRLGAIERVVGRFNLPNDFIPRTDIRWDLSIGGGATMDLGCYPLQWVRWAMGSEPKVVSATAEVPVEGIDGSLVAQLEWDGGVTGQIESSMIGAAGEIQIDLVVTGADGEMFAQNPLAPQQGSKLTVTDAAGTESIEVDMSTTYFHQLVAFQQAITSGTQPITSGHDTIATMELIDACYRAAGLDPRPSC